MDSNALRELVGEDIYRGFIEPWQDDSVDTFFERAAAELEPVSDLPGTALGPVLLLTITPPPPIEAAVPAPSFVSLDDAELERFVDAQRNDNTKRKTKSDLRKWYQWCETHGERRNIGEIPREELNRLLGHFYCKVRKESGEYLEPDTLTSIQRSLDRHLTKELHKTFSIIRDTEFASSNEKLKAARKMLKKEGKGNKPNASEALDEQEVAVLWETEAFGEENTIWYLLTMHMGMRGRDEHYKLLYGDFEVRSTTDGAQYVEFTERDTKTRTGELSHTRAFKPKMWSTPHNLERCPVRLFTKYLSKRPPEVCTPDSPFYLAVNHHPATPDQPWYKRQRMEKTNLGRS